MHIREFRDADFGQAVNLFLTSEPGSVIGRETGDNVLMTMGETYKAQMLKEDFSCPAALRKV